MVEFTGKCMGIKLCGLYPNLSSWQLLIGSTAYPQQLVKVDRPSECFMQNQKAFGSLYSTSHCGSATKLNFAKASSAGGEYFAYNAKPGTYANFLVDANVNKWYQCLDLEIINS